jgi:polysaccharide pyruvyl transferase WcaK-like protein
MYVLLHRALRNAGDHLIYQRARRLIETWRPDVELKVAEAWRPLDHQLRADELAEARAIIVCGGPGYGRGMPARYPIGDPSVLPAPLVLLALGSALLPGTTRQIERFTFDRESKRFLEEVARRAKYLGARDKLTAALLARNGVENVLMTGDPAWYDLATVDGPLRIPAEIRVIAVTPPADPAYFDQAIRLFAAIAAAHSDAMLHVVHHRGVQRPFARLAATQGWQTVDITGSADGFEVFDRADLHVGYRVHAHLYSMSHATPSYLIAEDSRGVGVHETLGVLGAVGFATNWDDPPHRLALAHLPRLANAYRGITYRFGRPVSRLLKAPRLDDAIPKMMALDALSGYERHEAARVTIRATLPTMRQMVDSLP